MPPIACRATARRCIASTRGRTWRARGLRPAPAAAYHHGHEELEDPHHRRGRRVRACGDGVRASRAGRRGRGHDRRRVDNCQFVYNFDQSDADGDRVGNRCDPDYDGDGDGAMPEYRYPGGPPADNCPGTSKRRSAGHDGDGVGDPCDVDTDVDGTADVLRQLPDRVQLRPGRQRRRHAGRRLRRRHGRRRAPQRRRQLRRRLQPRPARRDRDGRGYLCDADDRPAGAGPPATPPPDRTQPALRARRPERVRAGGPDDRAARGLRASEACSITARLSAGKRTLARGRATLAGAGRTYVFLRASAKTRRWLARRGRVRVTLSLRATDGSGNARAVEQATLRQR